jgi:hypothetical protein
MQEEGGERGERSPRTAGFLEREDGTPGNGTGTRSPPTAGGAAWPRMAPRSVGSGACGRDPLP